MTQFIIHFALCLCNVSMVTIYPCRFFVWLHGITFTLHLAIFLISPNDFYIVAFSFVPFMMAVITFKNK